ncbi:KilA-N domain-containing protein [Paludibacterium purpuratum]|uniref:KilA domain-containing protein n=1 Tax=Paludibacterium purpuratum TaxID=1144873 RepID=A0A4R7B5M5_9NEIS|nr:KilA-N domain-containing protein [Paludibacterium purpuratum]TDR79703.1 KilA domain-containing protein [Paludibacterium purpuratum]
MKNRSITVQGTSVGIVSRNEQDYISLTDMVRHFEGGGALIEQWLKNKDTVLFLGVWEQLSNPDFNSLEFEGIGRESGRNSFYLSVKKWIEATGAIGLHAKVGRYGGTYAHRDIAFEFGSWLSPEFKLYLIKEFQRLKDEEARAASLEWSFQRTLAKVNYRIHTDAIQEQLIPRQLTPAQTAQVYASEADLLNVALFGLTAAQWRQAHPEQTGNMRDSAALEQLVVLSNLESLNAVLIHQGLPPPSRLMQLNGVAIKQMCSLVELSTIKQLNLPTELSLSQAKSRADLACPSDDGPHDGISPV